MFELAGLKVPSGPHLSDEIRDRLGRGRYEQHELAALRAKLREGDVLMELGAGIGVVSAYCARVLGSRNVFTFEANPGLEPHIKELYRINGVSPTLEICALGDRHGEQALHVHDAFWASSTLPSQSQGSSATVTVPMRPFDEALREVRPTVLVIDIEGGELDLLPALRLDGVRAVVIEMHPQLIGEDGCTAVTTEIEDAGLSFDQAASSGFVFVFDREAPERAPGARAADYLPGRMEAQARAEICELVPSGAAFVLIDSGLWWRGSEFGHRDRRFLLERDGGDWGPPPDTATAMRELDLRRAEGAQLLVVAWPAFWLFEALPGFLEALRSDFACVSESHRLVAFDLRA